MKNRIPTRRRRPRPAPGSPRSLVAAATLSLLTLLLLGLATPPAATAQDSATLTPEAEAMLEQAAARTGLSREELLRRYRQERGTDAAAAETPAAPPGLTELPAGADEAPASRRGRAEPLVILPFDLDIEEAAADTLFVGLETDATAAELFGRDFFRLEPGDFAPPSFGPVPRDYLLGVGDEVVVDVWGDVEFRVSRLVDRDGAIVLPRGGKIACAGRTLEQVGSAVRAALAKSYSGIGGEPGEGTTFLDVGLGELRSIRVFVVGDAAQPGAYELSSTATVFAALHAAGGPGPNGSLRRVQLVRDGETVTTLDVYGYLTAGLRDGDGMLREGDTVFVPTRGATVVLDGAVRRPMAYELAGGETLDDLIRFGGGFAADAAADVVHVARIVSPERRLPNTPDREQLDLAPGARAELRDGDIVTVDRIGGRLENWVEVAGNVKRPGRYEYVPGMGVAQLVALAGGPWDDTLFEKALLDRVGPDGAYAARDVALGEVLAGRVDDVLLQPRDQLNVIGRWDVVDRPDVTITGAVRRAGAFPWRAGMTLEDLVLKAGGLTEAADPSRIEVARLSEPAAESGDAGEGNGPATRPVSTIPVALGEDYLTHAGGFALRPHDMVSVRELPWWELHRTVVLRGEVFYPGAYSLERPDERLSELIARAGGLKPTAFPDGARLVRAADGIGNVALDVRRALDKPGSEHDIILRSGDEVRLPQRPFTVKVDGAVGYPTSIVWQGGHSVGDYVARAGGYAEGADKWKTKVVYPNGESRKIRRVWRDPSVMPGSTIVVPWEPPREGDGSMAAIKEVAAIFASLATIYLVIDRTN